MIPNMRHPAQSLQPFIDWLSGEDLSILEIGCFAGDGTCSFLRSRKVARVTCVDPFRGGYDPDDTASGCNMDEVSQKWMMQVNACRGSKEVILCLGATWLQDVYDVIYIDGDHRYEAVKRDIEKAMNFDYIPEIVAGHDYNVAKHPGVTRAVDEMIPRKFLTTFPDTTWAMKL